MQNYENSFQKIITLILLVSMSILFNQNCFDTGNDEIRKSNDFKTESRIVDAENGMLEIVMISPDDFFLKDLNLILSQELPTLEGKRYVPKSGSPLLPFLYLDEEEMHPIISDNSENLIKMNLNGSFESLYLKSGMYFGSLDNGETSFQNNILSGINTKILGLFGYKYIFQPKGTSKFIANNISKCEYYGVRGEKMFLPVGFNKTECPKIIIKKGRTTTIRITISDARTDLFSSVIKWIPYIIFLAPVFYGFKTDIRDFKIELINP